jgi:hypothetical protein
VPPKLFMSLGYISANRASILRQDEHYLQMDENELPVEPRQQGVPSGSSKMISEPKVRLAQTVHLSCIQTDLNVIPHYPRHVGVPSDASKMISEPMVCSAHTVHLPCVKFSTISKWSKMSFQLSLVTLEYHWVCPK